MPSAIAPTPSGSLWMPASSANPTASFSANPGAQVGPSPAGFGIYIHWPFCASKCPYCDFNSHVRDSVDSQAWQDALVHELVSMAPYARGRTVSSIFFGGGTPSLMDPKITGALIDKVSALWPVAPDLEITLEANPSSVEADRFQAFRLAGVNRVSLGIQSFHDDALKFLGRGHSATEAFRAIDLARTHFDRMSFDLIYALPEQTRDSWQADLERALDLTVDHLSVYQLTIEQNTGFYGMWKRGQLKTMDEDLQADLYELTQLYLGAHDLPAYEVSNHARVGAESRHNLIYWRGGEWLGVGPGAHGRLNTVDGRMATRQIRKPEQWMEAVQRDGHGTEDTESVLPLAHAEEVLMMGLRLSEGIRINDIAARTGLALSDIVREEAIDDLVDDGFLWRKRGNVGATLSGRLVLNSVISALLAD